MTDTANPRSSRERVRSYRERQRAKGLKSVTFWLPDVNSPEFRAEARRQSLAVANDPDSDDHLAFIEQAFDWPQDE